MVEGISWTLGGSLDLLSCEGGHTVVSRTYCVSDTGAVLTRGAMGGEDRGVRSTWRDGIAGVEVISDCGDARGVEFVADVRGFA